MGLTHRVTKMTNKFPASFLIGIFLISLFGCAGSPYRTGLEAEANRTNMLKLKIGMNKDQILSLMGNPYKTEAYQIEGRNLEFWLYITEGKSLEDSGRNLRDSNFTPLVFENDTLTGWGRNYYDNTLRIKQDIKIEK